MFYSREGGLSSNQGGARVTDAIGRPCSPFKLILSPSLSVTITVAPTPCSCPCGVQVNTNPLPNSYHIHTLTAITFQSSTVNGERTPILDTLAIRNRGNADANTGDEHRAVWCISGEVMAK